MQFPDVRMLSKQVAAVVYVADNSDKRQNIFDCKVQNRKQTSVNNALRTSTNRNWIRKVC